MRRRPRATVFPDTHTMFPQPKHWPRLSGKTFEKRHMEKQCFSLLNGRRLLEHLALQKSRARIPERARPPPRRPRHTVHTWP